MKKMVHRGWLYLASIALLLVGFVGFSHTASAQELWVLGTKITNPLSTSQSQTGAGGADGWTGSWDWDASTKTLLLEDLRSNVSKQGVYAKGIPGFTIKVKGKCEFGTSAKDRSVIQVSGGFGFTIEGVGDGAVLKIRTRRGGSHGILIAKKTDLTVGNCFLDVRSKNIGITGEGDGKGVGIKIVRGARIDAYGGSGAIRDVKDYIKVSENNNLVHLNSSKTYAHTTLDDQAVEFKDGGIVFSGTTTLVKDKWIHISPYYPVRVGDMKLHRGTKDLTPDNYPSIIKSGNVMYNPSEHVLTLNNATLVSPATAIFSNHPSKFLTVVCKGTNKISTATGTAICAYDKRSPTIKGDGSGASLELLPSKSAMYPGVWDDTSESFLFIGNLDLKVDSKASTIYTNKSNKRVELSNINATLTSQVSITNGFGKLDIKKAYIASPAGAVVADGTIKLNGSTLTTCEIKRGNAPTYQITYDPLIKNGSVKVTNYGGNLNAVPMGTKLKVEATPKTGYHVTKITAGGENITSSKEFVVTRNAEISAQFEVNRYSVSVGSVSNGTITLSKSGTVDYGTEITVTATPDAGYELTALKAGSKDILSTKKFTVEGTVVVTATFSKMGKVFIAPVENGTIKVTGADNLNAVPRGTTLTVVATPKEGFALKTLTANGANILPSKKFTMDGNDVTVKAAFEVQTFAVTTAKTTNGTITLSGYPDMKKVPYGTTIKVDANPKAGYALAKLTANGEDITATKQFVVKKATKVEAVFSNETYAVTIAETSNGTIEVQGAADLKKVAKGTELTVVVWPDEGYELDKLLANEKDITATLKFKVEGATTLKATFKQTNGVGEVVEAVVILYPNPATEFATLKGVEAGATVQLFSLNGMEVLRTVADMVGTAHLDLSGLVAGEYLVKSGATTVRLLITK
ncbi:MAG: T9SS type A sorting domain-containing protein [Porphyromonas sp.]|nr:T9SS type A sorting domain-containing protein [Porphyromonas sp.]